MTIGIVLVACFAARIAGGVEEKDIDLELDEFRHEAWDHGPAFPLGSDTRSGYFSPQYNRDLAALVGMLSQGRDCRDRQPLQGILSAEFLWLLRLG